MRTFVHFDSGGIIHGIVNLDAPEGVTVMLEPEPGRLVAEVDSSELGSATLVSPTDDVEKVREFAKQHRVVTSPCGKLTKLY